MLSETLCKELFYVVLFGVVLTTVSFFRDHLKNAKPSAFLANIKCIIHDFKNAKYYKPWKTSKPIIVSSKKQIAELSEASVLSQRAVYADMFGFKYTLHGFNGDVVSNHYARLLGRVLQVNGVNNLPKLFPYMTKLAEESIQEHYRLGKPCEDGVSLPVAKTIRVITSRVNGLIFFGKKLYSNDPEFADALLRHPSEMISCMAAFQFTPTCLASLVHKLFTRKGEAQAIIIDRFKKMFSSDPNSWDEESPLKQLTLLWSMAENSQNNEHWSPDLLAQSLLGTWFASAHQPWMNLDFITLQLCVRPEMQEALREEIGDIETLDYHRLQNLPLLDSFIKETVRLHPLDTLAVRRKALEEYSFAGGAPFIPSGSTVCVSSYDLMHNEKDYPQPNKFQPRRFIDVDSPVRGTKFTEVSEKFPVWGYGSLACPGRFHASIVIKLIIAHLVTRYQIRLEDEKARRLWSFETFTMPYESTRFILKERT